MVGAAGELDLHTAPILRDALNEAVNGGSPVLVVDLCGVDFMDSSGLSVIIATVAALAGTERVLRVASSNERVTKVFTLTGVDRSIPVFPSVEEAVAG